jgi:O-methyltransferase
MLGFMKRGIRRVVRNLGYDIVALADAAAQPQFPPDFDQAMIGLWNYVRPYTMTSKERIFALREAVEYVVRHNIPGDIVECGVWKGGSMMAVARTLTDRGVSDRKLHLFDTFEGMPEPTDADRSFRHDAAKDLLRESDRETALVWAYSPLDEVKRNLRDTGYPEANIAFVQGKVEVTLPAAAPDRIALLRLDTDWYESTRHELVHLYPRLSVGGVLIIDDYGHWEGARRAVDEFLADNRRKILLNRIDYTGRIAVKVEP